MLRKFQGCQESVKCVSRKFHKKFQGCIKNLLMKFLLQFCCMNLIAATRADGGLVYLPGVEVQEKHRRDKKSGFLTRHSPLPLF